MRQRLSKIQTIETACDLLTRDYDVIGLDIHHLSHNITWDAIFQQWPWFVAAGAVLVVAVGVFALLKPKSKVQFERAKVVGDGKDWTWTGRIDLAHPKSAEDFVLRVEETLV